MASSAVNHRDGLFGAGVVAIFVAVVVAIAQSSVSAMISNLKVWVIWGYASLSLVVESGIRSRSGQSESWNRGTSVGLVGVTSVGDGGGDDQHLVFT